MNGTVELTLPKGVNIPDAEIKMVVAAKLFEMGELSSGQAAEMAGMTKRKFLESIGKYGVSIFGYDAAELRKDMKSTDKELSVEERLAIVEELSGVASVEGKPPPTDEEWREDRANYLGDKYK